MRGVEAGTVILTSPKGRFVMDAAQPGPLLPVSTGAARLGPMGGAADAGLDRGLVQFYIGR